MQEHTAQRQKSTTGAEVGKRNVLTQVQGVEETHGDLGGLRRCEVRRNERASEGSKARGPTLGPCGATRWGATGGECESAVSAALA